MPFGQPHERLATDLQVGVVQGSKKRLSEFERVNIGLSSKSKNSPTAHISIHIRGQADQALDRRYFIMAEKSKSDSKPDLGIGMIRQRDKVRHSACVTAMAESDCRAINDMGVFISQKPDQFPDRLVQMVVVAPAKLRQDISSNGPVLGIRAVAVFETDL